MSGRGGKGRGSRRAAFERAPAAGAKVQRAPVQREGHDESLAQLLQQCTAKPETYAPKAVAGIYQHLRAADFERKKISFVEVAGYLERCLWPHYTPEASQEHVLSIVWLLNEKFIAAATERPWQVLLQAPAHFPAFFNHVRRLTLSTDSSLSLREHTALLHFLIRAFQSVEHDMVRVELTPLCGLGTWRALFPARRQQLFTRLPRLAKGWKSIQKKRSKLSEEEQSALAEKDLYIHSLIARFLSVLDSIKEGEPVPAGAIDYCERALELFIDIEALLTSRRYLNAVIDAAHLVPHCRLSDLANMPSGELFSKLVDMLQYYVHFEIDDYSGEPLTDDEMTKQHYSAVLQLQQLAFKDFPELRDFALANVSRVDTFEGLTNHLARLSDRRLHELCAQLALVPPPGEEPEGAQPLSREQLLDVLLDMYERRQSQLEQINATPLYPTEELLWDERQVPSERYTDGCLALPKLNLQFLTLFDYLLRNFKLFQMENVYAIRTDLEDHLPRLQAYINSEGSVAFEGWSRMAQPMIGFTVVEVARPNVGETHPSSVRADVTLHLNLRSYVRNEWLRLRKHDIGFLVTLRPAPLVDPGTQPQNIPFAQRYGVVAVRGCEIEGLLDYKGHVIEEGPEDRRELPPGDRQTVRVWLDPAQYQKDVDTNNNVNSSFNVFVRRSPKENNFKAVLETIRDLINTHCVVPDWLHDIFLGYGDPGSAHYSKLHAQADELVFNDTFLDLDHVKESFPGRVIEAGDKPNNMKPPFKISFGTKKAEHVLDKLIPRAVAATKKKGGKSEKKKEEDEQEEGRRGDDDQEAPDANAPLRVTPYRVPNRGPYPHDVPRRNTVRFTPAQIEAIRSGMQPGLTLVVGPPGTGKTDVAVQIIANLYHNNPEQRTLIVTHSNQALNQLFEKIMALDIEERHLLRLGRGEEELGTDKNFSRFGRVDYILEDRLRLLDEVVRLSKTLKDVTAALSYSCETAWHLYVYHIRPKWEEYFNEVRVSHASTPDDIKRIAEAFPFAEFFSNAPQPIFKGRDYAEDLEVAEGCQRHMHRIFERLNEYRAFELVHRSRDRAKYLLVKEAKIIAMTCTHAALTRSELVKYGFRYDNVIMEEAAQILEVETFIPLMLQTPEDGYNRLKRVVLIGDHHQLPPVIKNDAFRKFSNLEQSMFARFVRLGVPYVQLDAQGRMRPSLADLFRWNYEGLKDLKNTVMQPSFQLANPGFRWEYQLIDVGDFQGVGESAPSLHFIQNLGEAEYVVAMYMYMRLLGYPAERITILTTYQGQKALLTDVATSRCANHPYFGMPAVIETVDKYQGSQNDYVLLSLVRTKAVGFLRDVRRLVVAMSRARLGLYVFCRQALFEECPELQPVFSLLGKRPTALELYPNETYGATERKVDDVAAPYVVVTSTEHMAQSVYSMASERVEQDAAQRAAELQAREAETNLRQAEVQAEIEAANAAAEAEAAAAGVQPESDSDEDEAEPASKRSKSQKVEKQEKKKGKKEDKKEEKRAEADAAPEPMQTEEAAAPQEASPKSKGGRKRKAAEAEEAQTVEAAEAKTEAAPVPEAEPTEPEEEPASQGTKAKGKKASPSKARAEEPAAAAEAEPEEEPASQGKKAKGKKASPSKARAEEPAAAAEAEPEEEPASQGKKAKGKKASPSKARAEEPTAEDAAATEAPAGGAASLSADDIDKMKVAELKKELKDRGLPHSGRKAELQAELRKAVGL